MPLPNVIEVQPLRGPVKAGITLPGSKSITNRALICAALAGGVTVVRGALWSEDTEVMFDALRRLGFSTGAGVDSKEPGNRTLRIEGAAGIIPESGTAESPVDLFVGNAGTAARFLAAMACLGRGVYRLDGVPRMRQRPQGALFGALRQLGYRIESERDKLPATIHGGGPRSGSCDVSIEESSQFASALLLCARQGKWRVRVTGDNMEESPYVRMTEKLVEAFPHAGGEFQVEPDASSGSYFWGAAHLLEGAPDPWARAAADASVEGQAGFSIANWPGTGWQIDAEFPKLLSWNREQAFGKWQPAKMRRHVSRASDLGDSIMTAIVLAPFWREPALFTDLGRLRLQECERVLALRCELEKCGAQIREIGDALEVTPSRLHGARIETYNDHRMAMCFAMLGVKVPGLQIINPACVKKTFPNFFQKLAAPPPNGLGCVILNAETNAPLGLDDLNPA